MRKRLLGTALAAIILLLVCGPGWALALDSGWLDPNGGGGDFNSGINAFWDDGQYAYQTGSSLYHDFDSYAEGLAIPDCAEIDGIEVRVDWYAVETGGAEFSLGAQLTWNWGANWSDAYWDDSEPTSEKTVVFGGPTDTWGHDWTPEELSFTNFEVEVVAESTSESTEFRLEWVPVTVYYTPCEPIGGIVEPLDRLALLAPWLAVAGLLALAVMPTLYQRRQRA